MLRLIIQCEPWAGCGHGTPWRTAQQVAHTWGRWSIDMTSQCELPAMVRERREHSIAFLHEVPSCAKHCVPNASRRPRPQWVR
jgi:hypothetical protein